MVIRESLMELGLTKKEASVYLEMLRTDLCSAPQLAELAGIKRTSVYDIIKSLLEKNLIRVEIQGTKKLYSVTEPDVFLDNHQKQLSKLKYLLPELNALYNKIPFKPKVKYYHGSDNIQQLTDDLLTVKSGSYHYFASMRSQITVEGLEHAREFVLKRIQKGIKSYSIRSREEEIHDDIFHADENLLRYVRYYPEPIFEDIANLYIYDNKVAIISSTTEQYGLVIESNEYSKLMKSLWDVVWNLSTE